MLISWKLNCLNMACLAYARLSRLLACLFKAFRCLLSVKNLATIVKFEEKQHGEGRLQNDAAMKVKKW